VEGKKYKKPKNKMTRQTNQRIIRGCFGNGITWSDVISDQSVAHVSEEGRITWYSDYKKQIPEATKKHIQETSLEYQTKAMISIESIIRPSDTSIMASYFFKNSQGQYRHLADIYYPKERWTGGGIYEGGVFLKVWEGIIPPEILEEMNQIYKSKFSLEIA
jgi:hypothetical protein